MVDKKMWANRIREFKTLPASDFQTHKRNWRVHPEAQSKVTEASLDDHGIFMPLVAYESTEFGGLTLLNGHDRIKLSPSTQEWPVVILDVSDDSEADEILLLIDSIPEMATANANLAILQRRFADNPNVNRTLLQFSNHMLTRHGQQQDFAILGSGIGTGEAGGNSNGNNGEENTERNRTDGGSSISKFQHDGATKMFEFGNIMVMLPIELYNEFEAWVKKQVADDVYVSRAEAVEAWMLTAAEVFIAKEL